MAVPLKAGPQRAGRWVGQNFMVLVSCTVRGLPGM